MSSQRYTSVGRQLHLAAGMLIAMLGILPIAYWWGGGRHMLSAVICAGACWLGGATAILVRTKMSRPEQAFLAVGVALMLRMTPPLLLVMLAIFFHPGLDKPSAIYYLLFFYMAALFMETWTAVPRPGDRQRSCEPEMNSTDHGQFRRTD